MQAGQAAWRRGQETPTQGGDICRLLDRPRDRAAHPRKTPQRSVKRDGRSACCQPVLQVLLKAPLCVVRGLTKWGAKRKTPSGARTGNGVLHLVRGEGSVRMLNCRGYHTSPTSGRARHETSHRGGDEARMCLRRAWRWRWRCRRGNLAAQHGRRHQLGRRARRRGAARSRAPRQGTTAGRATGESEGSSCRSSRLPPAPGT